MYSMPKIQADEYDVMYDIPVTNRTIRNGANSVPQKGVKIPPMNKTPLDIMMVFTRPNLSDKIPNMNVPTMDPAKNIICENGAFQL